MTVTSEGAATELKAPSIYDAIGGRPSVKAAVDGLYLRLFADPDSASYIGNVYFGRTPLRAPVHDSLLLEIPDRKWDRTFETVCMEMQRPVIEQPLPASWNRPGEYVAIGVAAKAGNDWQAMEEIVVPGYDATWTPEPMESEDEDDWNDLQRVIA